MGWSNEWQESLYLECFNYDKYNYNQLVDSLMYYNNNNNIIYSKDLCELILSYL